MSSILPKNEQRITILSIFEKMLRILLFCWFFGRIENTMNGFRDFLTFISKELMRRREPIAYDVVVFSF